MNDLQSRAVPAVTVPGSQPMVRPDGRAAVRLETRQLGSIAFEVGQLAIDALRHALAAVETHLRLSRKPEIDASGRPDRLRLHPFLPQHLADSTYRLARALISSSFPLPAAAFPDCRARLFWRHPYRHARSERGQSYRYVTPCRRYLAAVE